MLTAGLAAPWAVASVIADVSAWVTRLAKEVADTVASARNLGELLKRARRLLDDVGEAFARIPAKAGETATRVGTDIAATAQRRVEQVQDLASSLGPQPALAGTPAMTLSMAQARRTGKARPTAYRPDGPKTPNPNKGRWGQTLNEAGAGAKGGDDAAEAARPSAKQSDDAAKANAPERVEADSSAATGEGATQWDDPGKVQEWYDELPTKTRSPSTEAYQYQHRVLGTDVERQLTTDSGETVWADSVTTDGTGITKAWDAKHTGGGDSALYQGKAPEFLMGDFNDEMKVYGEVIRSSGNPVSSLTLVTNTPESAEFLGQRARDILGPDVELHIQLVP
ncbi:hypothetical protein [Actinomyces viscosus]|uniref:Tox-REase-5 domain-containing protein n=1 Tax=Actinomyces viscosus TaxID=1656 RepID=A0A3S4VK50_ACTVI|nr:hypothetical protein [Actinomyces viscosus]VEI16314.1 Uncharacterised protein [Actinomyces viscosus]